MDNPLIARAMSQPTPNTDATLAQLRDIHLPSPISIWPPSSGVIALFCFSIAFLCAVYGYRQFQRKKRFKKEALRLLSQIKHHYEQNHSKRPTALTQSTASEISSLLRRLALVYYPRGDVAGLHGKAWVNFLNQHSKKPSQSQLNLFTEALVMLPYQADASVDLEPLFEHVKSWIKAQGGRLHV